MQLDKGIYSASAGIKSCSAWLMVEGNEQNPYSYQYTFAPSVPILTKLTVLCAPTVISTADTEPAPTGKKKARKTTQAGGAGVNLEKVAEEQQGKLQKEKEERIEAIIKAKEEQQATMPENVVEEKTDDSALVKDPPVGRDTSKDKQTEIPPKKQEPPVVKSSISDGGQLKLVKEEPKVDKSPKPVKTSPVVPTNVIGKILSCNFEISV